MCHFFILSKKNCKFFKKIHLTLLDTFLVYSSSMNIKIDLKEMIETAKKINLLYVEDDEIVRTKTGSLLRLLFQNIDIAQNGEEGLMKYQ